MPPHRSRIQKQVRRNLNIQLSKSSVTPTRTLPTPSADHYIENLGANIKFKYDSQYYTSKILNNATRFISCLKNTCVALYWYKQCILNDNYEKFNIVHYDEQYDIYWSTLLTILPKIYNMYQSYNQSRDAHIKHSVSRKCSLVSLILGLSGLLSTGLVMHDTPVIIAVNPDQVSFHSGEIDMLDWNLAGFRTEYEKKMVQLNIEQYANVLTHRQELYDSFNRLHTYLQPVQKKKGGNSITYFCDIVKNKSGKFSYISNYNAGTKTIIDVCHACDMDPKTMNRMFYSK
jgi:hypothetical protein